MTIFPFILYFFLFFLSLSPVLRDSVTCVITWIIQSQCLLYKLIQLIKLECGENIKKHNAFKFFKDQASSLTMLREV